jgi:DNA-binding NarL/FixJ family response regulator
MANVLVGLVGAVLAGILLCAFTKREREVAHVVGSGAANAEIARSLFMSEATVKAHVSRLFSKLDATNRVQIAIVVHDAGAN